MSALRHQPRRTLAVSLRFLLAAAMLLPLLPEVGRASAAPGWPAADSGAVPSASLDQSIWTDELYLATTAQRKAVAAETASVDNLTAMVRADRTSLTSLTRDLATQQATSASRNASYQSDTTSELRITTALEQARTANRRARANLNALTVQLYQGPTGAGDGPTSAVLKAETRRLPALVGAWASTDKTRQDLSKRYAAAAAVTAQALSALRAAQASVATTAGDIVTARRRLGADTASLEAVTAGLNRARQSLATARDSFAAAVGVDQAEAGITGNSAPSPVPRILGPNVLTAKQLGSWFLQQGYADRLSMPIDTLAGLYLQDGTAEGVRGDIAFAQAVLETGGFSSSDATGYFNFAGISHCDSCSHGAAFPSVAAGVNGQIQLLRTWATPGLTTAQLATPPVEPWLAPEEQTERGCCSTWNSLTGTWASSTSYGNVILDLYAEMLASAVTAQRYPDGQN